jgi:MFS family permease
VARAVLPLVAIAAAGDYGAGAFNSIWSIWLGSRGATPWEIGVSFCLFALPSVALSALLGAFTDRRGPQRIVAGSLVGLALAAPLCALHASVLTLTLVAMVIGLFCTPNRPVVFAAASREFPGQFLARAQGTLQGGLMSVQFVAALASGALLNVSATLAFGALSVVAAGSLAVALRRPSLAVRPA